MITTSGYMLIGFFAAFLVASLLAGPTKSGLSARRVYTLSAILLAGATLAISNAEECSAVDAFYLSTMVFTTIGYGDIDHPVTPAGRATVMALALGGISFFGVTMELFHAAREATDGAVLKRLGLGDGTVAIAMLVVNALLGVALCEYLADDLALPKGNTLDAAYWAIITGSSVGFGDHHPTTEAGKLVVCAYAYLSMQATGNAMDVAKDWLVSACTVRPKLRSQFSGAKLK